MTVHTLRRVFFLVVILLALALPGTAPAFSSELKPLSHASFQSLRAEKNDGRFVHFENVSAAAGMPAGMSPTYGAAWGDFDNDGWVDLFIGHHAKTPALMRNQGDGTFANVTTAAGITIGTDRHGCEWGEVDNDGWIDLYCNSGGQKGTGEKPNQLWRNKGDGTFEDVAPAMNVVDGPGRGRSTNWFDYNGDNLLDLFVGNQFIDGMGEPSRLYRNDGATFTDVARKARLGKRILTRAVAFSDFDQDGDWDLTIASGQNLTLYRKNGNGKFKALSADETGLHADGAMSLAWGDYNNDGFVDLYAPSWFSNSRLFRNDRRGHLIDVTDGSGLEAVNKFAAKGALWGDFDNDGDLDLFVVRCGSVKGQNAPDVMMRNDGGGKFENVTFTARVQGPPKGQCDEAAAADYDKDGNLDLFVTNGWERPGKGILFRNLGSGNHWLRIELVGTQSNTLGLGSKIWLTVGGKTQYREYLDGGAGVGQSQMVAHFGLGEITLVDSIRIEWPNHQTQELTNVNVDQLLRIVQPQ